MEPKILSVAAVTDTWTIHKSGDEKPFACKVDAICLMEDVKFNLRWLQFHSCDTSGLIEAIEEEGVEVFHGTREEVVERLAEIRRGCKADRFVF